MSLELGGIPSGECEKERFLKARQGGHKQKRLFQAKVMPLWGMGWGCMAVTSSSSGGWRTPRRQMSSLVQAGKFLTHHRTLQSRERGRSTLMVGPSVSACVLGLRVCFFFFFFFFNICILCLSLFTL